MVSGAASTGSSPLYVRQTFAFETLAFETLAVGDRLRRRLRLVGAHVLQTLLQAEHFRVQLGKAQIVDRRQLLRRDLVERVGEPDEVDPTQEIQYAGLRCTAEGAYERTGDLRLVGVSIPPSSAIWMTPATLGSVVPPVASVPPKPISTHWITVRLFVSRSPFHSAPAIGPPPSRPSSA